MEKKYAIELSDLNVFFIAVGIILLFLALAAFKWHIKRKNNVKVLFLENEKQDLEDQRQILMDENLKLKNACASLSDQLKKAKKQKQHYQK